MNIKGWLAISLPGLVIIALQLFMPDLVPDIINDLIATNASHKGVVPILKATLGLYYVGGIAFFFVGSIGALVSFKRSKSE